MKISIFASIWSQNLWDELILKNEIKLLENEYWSNTQFFVFSYDFKNPFFKKDNVKYIEYFPFWIKNSKNIFRNIFNLFSFLNIISGSNLIIIWWGWIIYDTEKQINKNPLDQWVFRTRVFRFFRKKFEFFAVWINIKNKINLEKVKKIFKKASKISVRDKYSLSLLKDLWIKSNLVIDPVFYDNYSTFEKSFTLNNEQKSVLIKKVNSSIFNFKNLEGINFEWKTVWIAFRRWYLNNTDAKLTNRIEEWKINEIINYIFKNWWKIILLPHSFHQTDIMANDFLFLKNFLRDDDNLSICESMEEVYDIYVSKKIDICLAMRLHSIILSQVYQIPFIWVSYSTKTDEVLNFIEKSYEE